MTQATGFQDLLKFSDSLVCSTSASFDQVSVWEPGTLAPLDSFRAEKFFVGPNTLAVERDGHLVGSHIQKTSLSVWRWDCLREPCLRAGVKDEVTAMRILQKIYIVLTTKKGTILIFQMSSGACLAEIEDAHYLSINDIAVSNDFCVTGGKDTKVRVWLTNDLFVHQHTAAKPYHEFGDA